MVSNLFSFNLSKIISPLLLHIVLLNQKFNAPPVPFNYVCC